MKELKFRAWHKDAETMIFPNDDDYIWEYDMNGFSILEQRQIHCAETGNTYFDWQVIENIVFMQYTGLKDRNGKEIYEGDILDENMFVKYCDECKQFQLLLSSLNDDGSDYCLACNGDMHWYEIVSDMTYEVIGNIYENPELLEAK